MEQLTHVVTVISNTPPDLLMFFLSGLPLAAFQQKVKKWFSIQSAFVKQMIAVGFSLLAVGLPYALNFVQLNPTYFAGYASTVFVGMTLFYTKVVKPVSKNLAEFKEFKQVTTSSPAAPLEAPAPRTPGKFLG